MYPFLCVTIFGYHQHDFTFRFDVFDTSSYIGKEGRIGRDGVIYSNGEVIKESGGETNFGLGDYGHDFRQFMEPDLKGCFQCSSSETERSNVVQLGEASQTTVKAEDEFNCGQEYDYHGHPYATVEIGGRCWFAENLQTTTYRNGDHIPQNLSEADWSEATSGAMAFHVDVPTYGGLYNWYAVDDARGLCPSDWHIPTDMEWTILTDHLGGEFVAKDRMKTDYGYNVGGNGTNSSGFSGLPGGFRDGYGFFYYAGSHGIWWSSSPIGSDAWTRSLGNDYEHVYRDFFHQQNGFSVRCVRDAE